MNSRWSEVGKAVFTYGHIGHSPGPMIKNEPLKKKLNQFKAQICWNKIVYLENGILLNFLL